MRIHFTSLCFVLAGLLTACAAPPKAEVVTLKGAFRNEFLIGAALNPDQFCESNALEAALVKQQFNSISPENVMKWEPIHPLYGRYDFTLADRYVEFGERNKMAVIGHSLIWHSQTPAWVFQDERGNPASRDVLLGRMREHIFTVVGRYKNRIKGWDVVNEALNEDGTLRPSLWLKIIGEDYLLKAYQFAHEADPKAELYYNDFSLENAPKRRGAIALIKRLQAGGIPVKAVGLQGHYKLNWPSDADLDATIAAFASLGINVNITELDIDVLPSASASVSADISRKSEPAASLNPYPDGLPDSVQTELATRYAALFSTLLRHRGEIGRVTFWGVTDGDSWLNDWPIQGRASYPLLFDRAGKPKAAFDAVINLSRP